MARWGPDIEDVIQIAINDQAGATWTSAKIHQIFDEVGGDVGLTIAHILFAEALTLAEPTAPTTPTFKTEKAMQQWDREIAVYRARLEYNRAMADIQAEQARMWVDIAKGAYS